MSIELMIYLASVADNLKVLFIIIFTVALTGTIISFVGMIEEDCKPKVFYSFFSAMFIFSILSILTPNKETVYAIAAVDLSKKVIESKGIQTLYDKTYKLIENKLDEQLEKK